MDMPPTATWPPQYPIRAVARMTGLSLDTLRAWERRYQVVTPSRDQRGRLYDDRVRQVRPTWEALRKAEEELNRMSRERTVDVATYSVHVTNAEALRSEFNKTRYVLIYSISRRLSADQHLKLREIAEKRFGRRGGGPRADR